ncbi:MAG: hypothetical protein U9O94_00110 [Nanoarchaeota archaeon]|nr:hypothetical protein [Nanoarchaeota archaeon]
MKKTQSRRGFLESVVTSLAGIATIGTGATFGKDSPQSEKVNVLDEDFNGYWIRRWNTGSYNAKDYPDEQFFNEKDHWDGISWDGKFLNGDDVRVNDGKVFFGKDGKERYFHVSGLVRDPTKSIWWQAFLDETGDSLYESIEECAITKDHSDMTKAIMQDMFEIVPLRYFRQEGMENITDKNELSKHLTKDQIGVVMEVYTQLRHFVHGNGLYPWDETKHNGMNAALDIQNEYRVLLDKHSKEGYELKERIEKGEIKEENVDYDSIHERIETESISLAERAVRRLPLEYLEKVNTELEERLVGRGADIDKIKETVETRLIWEFSGENIPNFELNRAALKYASSELKQKLLEKYGDTSPGDSYSAVTALFNDIPQQGQYVEQLSRFITFAEKLNRMNLRNFIKQDPKYGR